MPDNRDAWHPGGTCFFTVNLLNRKGNGMDLYDAREKGWKRSLAASILEAPDLKTNNRSACQNSFHEPRAKSSIARRQSIEKVNAMSVKLNERGFEHAKGLIKQGHVVSDGRDAWSEHQPSAQDENEFIRLYGIGEYAKWHLGIDDEEEEEKKGRYKFPYGDFKSVHRCAILSAESRAGQYKYQDVQMAAAHLHGMIEAMQA
jgi:hypothetical protein